MSRSSCARRPRLTWMRSSPCRLRRTPRGGGRPMVTSTTPVPNSTGYGTPWDRWIGGRGVAVVPGAGPVGRRLRPARRTWSHQSVGRSVRVGSRRAPATPRRLADRGGWDPDRCTEPGPGAARCAGRVRVPTDAVELRTRAWRRHRRPRVDGLARRHSVGSVSSGRR